MNQSSSVNKVSKDETVIDEQRQYSRKIGISLFSLIFILTFFIWAGFTITRPDFMPVRSVRIEGEFQRLSPDKLQGLVVNTVRGGFFNVNVEVIQNVLLDDPWVQQVNVIRKWPDSLIVRVSEKMAVAKWNNSSLISMEGTLFSPEPDTYPEGLPELTGPDNTQNIMLEQYQMFNEMLKDTELEIVKLSLNDRRSWNIDLDNGALLRLGRNEIQDRMHRFVSYAVTDPGRKGKIDTIDLRYTNGFAVKWKTGSNYSDVRQNNHG